MTDGVNEFVIVIVIGPGVNCWILNVSDDIPMFCHE